MTDILCVWFKVSSHMCLARTTETPAGHASRVVFCLSVDYANTLLEYMKWQKNVYYYMVWQ
jgi:hypothetical protein